jgi:phage-related protein (TIGR01555 family)
MNTAVNSPSSGAGGTGDTTRAMLPGGFGDGQPGFNLGYNRNMALWTMAFQPDTFYYMLWRKYWEARKIVNIPAYDMMKKGWEYANEDIDSKVFEDINQQANDLKIYKVFYKALEYERKYGGAVIVIGTAETQEDPAMPLTPNLIKEGGLLYLTALGRGVVKGTEMSQSILSPKYNEPEYYFIRGVKVHKSRLLVFDGGGQDDRESIGIYGHYLGAHRYDGFGVSVLESLYNDVFFAQATRQSAMQLVNKASLNIFSVDMTEIPLDTKTADEKIADLKYILDSISSYRGAVLDQGTKFDTYNSTFGSVPELIITYLQVLSAASDIPAPRFLGEAPGGLNASGKGDLKNYYDSIHSQQEINLKPQIEKLLPYLIKSATGKDFDDIRIEFRSLFETTESEQADIRGKDFNVIQGAVNSGIAGDNWANKEAMDRNIFLNNPLEIEEEDPVSEEDMKNEIQKAIKDQEMEDELGLIKKQEGNQEEGEK